MLSNSSPTTSFPALVYPLPASLWRVVPFYFNMLEISWNECTLTIWFGLIFFPWEMICLFQAFFPPFFLLPCLLWLTSTSSLLLSLSRKDNNWWPGNYKPQSHWVVFAHLELGVGFVLGKGNSTVRVTNICPSVETAQGGVKISWKFGKSGEDSMFSLGSGFRLRFDIVNKIWTVQGFPRLL